MQRHVWDHIETISKSPATSITLLCSSVIDPCSATVSGSATLLDVWDIWHRNWWWCRSAGGLYCWWFIRAWRAIGLDWVVARSGRSVRHRWHGNVFRPHWTPLGCMAWYTRVLVNPWIMFRGLSVSCLCDDSGNIIIQRLIFYWVVPQPTSMGHPCSVLR